MVVLKNIKKSENYIEADYYLEGTDKGYMKIKLLDGTVVEHVKPDEIAYGSSHARRELMRMAMLEQMPKEKTVIWY